MKSSTKPSEKYPQLLEEWIIEVNDGKIFDDFPISSSYQATWKCSKCENLWKSQIRGRTSKKTSCPFCSTLNKSIYINFPELMLDWSAKNDKNPKTITKGSTYKAHWKCHKCNYEWQTTVGSRTQGHGCNKCQKNSRLKPLKKENNLTNYPDLMTIWNFKKNQITPDKYSRKSGEKVYWLCPNCNFSWQRKIRNQQNKNCPNCHLEKIGNTIKDKFPHLLREWDYTKNIILPEQCSPSSMKQIYWICSVCNFSWQETPNSRTRYGKLKCNSCKKIPEYNQSISSLRKDLLSEWDYEKNDIDPSQIHAHSKKMIWWKCQKHSTSYRTRLSDKVRNTKNIDNSIKSFGCYICITEYKMLLRGAPLLQILPEITQEWDYNNNEFSIENYTSGSEKRINLICNQCHKKYNVIVKEKVKGNSHCPSCHPANRSIGELEIEEYIQSLGIRISQNRRGIIPNKELDIYIPSHQIAIEYNGEYWHTENKVGKTYHYDKWLICQQQGIQLIIIWENDWKNNKELVKKMLSHKLGKSEQRKIYARKSVLNEIQYKESKKFLDKNHIQGSRTGSKYLGLYYDDILIAVSVWTFKGKVCNLERYATNEQVIGGMGKFISYVTRNYSEIKEIHTFADHQVSDGKLYEKLGFTKTQELKPDYSYYHNNETHHKFNYRKERFNKDPNLLFDENLTETQLAALNNIEKIWDAGKAKYILYIS